MVLILQCTTTLIHHYAHTRKPIIRLPSRTKRCRQYKPDAASRRHLRPARPKRCRQVNTALPYSRGADPACGKSRVQRHRHPQATPFHTQRHIPCQRGILTAPDKPGGIRQTKRPVLPPLLTRGPARQPRNVRTDAGTKSRPPVDGAEKEGFHEFRPCMQHLVIADGRADQRPRHPRQKRLPQIYSASHDRRPHGDNFHTPGARHRPPHRPCDNHERLANMPQPPCRRNPATPEIPHHNRPRNHQQRPVRAAGHRGSRSHAPQHRRHRL